METCVAWGYRYLEVQNKFRRKEEEEEKREEEVAKHTYPNKCNRWHAPRHGPPRLIFLCPFLSVAN
jgi:hypothetical protein